MPFACASPDQATERSWMQGICPSINLRQTPMQDNIDLSCPATGPRYWALMCQPLPPMAKDDLKALLLLAENSLKQKDIRHGDCLQVASRQDSEYGWDNLCLGMNT